MKGDTEVINSNIYKEDTSYVRERDPRELNAVARLEEVREMKKNRQFINDEDVQYPDLEKEITIAIEEIKDDLVEESGTPGNFVKLNEYGVIDPQYIPDSSGLPAARTAVMTAPTHFEFPTIGLPDVVYIATNENEGKGYIYRWCDGLNCYEKPYDSLDNVSEINGGSAEVI